MRKIYVEVPLLKKGLSVAQFVSIFQLTHGRVTNYVPPLHNVIPFVRFADLQVIEYAGI